MTMVLSSSRKHKGRPIPNTRTPLAIKFRLLLETPFPLSLHGSIAMIVQSWAKEVSTIECHSTTKSQVLCFSISSAYRTLFPCVHILRLCIHSHTNTTRSPRIVQHVQWRFFGRLLPLAGIWFEWLKGQNSIVQLWASFLGDVPSILVSSSYQAEFSLSL